MIFIVVSATYGLQNAVSSVALRKVSRSKATKSDDMTKGPSGFVWVFEVRSTRASVRERLTIEETEDEAVERAAALLANTAVHDFRVLRVRRQSRYARYYEPKPG